MTAVLENTVLPIDIRKTSGALGFAEKVFVEVVVSKILRKALRMEDRSVFQLAAVHYVSQPVMGGFIAPLGDVTTIQGSSYQQALMDGAKGVPAVFFAQYVVNTSFQGVHVPKISIKDAFITAAAKALSRPLMKFAVPKLGTDIQEHFVVSDQLVGRQVAMSNLKRG